MLRADKSRKSTLEFRYTRTLAQPAAAQRFDDGFFFFPSDEWPGHLDHLSNSRGCRIHD